MNTRHVATAALGSTLLLGACGSGSSGSKASTGTSTAPNAAAATTVTTVAGSPEAVRTDDLESDLQSVDHELDGAQQDVNQANDTSPERADD